MTNEYRAYFLTGSEKLELRNIEFPEISTDEALIKLFSANLCPTDLKKYYHLNNDIAQSLGDKPVILGHEAAGVVEAIGDTQFDVKVGDRVAIDPMLPCKECVYCQSGDFPMCLNLRGLGASAGSIKTSQELLENGFGGMFAEYVKVPVINLYKLPDDMDFATGCLMEPLADVLHSIEAGAPQHNDTAVVIGLGAMGLMHVKVLSLRGVNRIIGIDPLDSRREKAMLLGATNAINPDKEDPITEILNLTDNLGADLFFVCAGGSAQVEVTKHALQSVRKKGRILLYASALKPSDISVDVNHIHYNMLHLTGTVGFYPRHGHEALDLLEQGKINLEIIRTPVLPFEKLSDAFMMSLEPSVTKVGIEIFDV